jgi:NAD(P)-dependent dehydrogenase (short-subunit alcohol dehydrogenase family)
MKTAIVTGASGNLGKAIVKKFLSEGYHVAGTIIENDPVMIDINDKNFETFVADLANEDDANKVVEAIVSKRKTIDAAILTVGGFAMGKVVDTNSAALVKQYQLNFLTAYHVARPVFNQMIIQGHGRIFMIGSRTGSDMHMSKGMIAYGLSKSLIFRLAELMNDEAKGKDVVTCVVAPSTIDTPQNRESMPKADFSSWVKAEAIADAIHFYCTPSASALREPILKAYNNA